MTAREIAAAMELARSRVPDFAIIDLSIHNESGLDLVRGLAAMEAGTRMVALTGYTSIATAGALNMHRRTLQRKLQKYPVKR